jgi:hypothetical protein
VHRLSPTVDFDVAAVLGRSLSVEASGAFLPYVLMLEDGSKLYSTYPTAIPYSLQNVCMGCRGNVGLSTSGLPIGDVSLGAEATWLFGKYGTVQEIVAGNYKTTIETYDDYSSLTGEGFVEYRMTWLSGLVGIVPALRVGCGLMYETYGTQVTGPSYLWKAGISLGSR